MIQLLLVHRRTLIKVERCQVLSQVHLLLISVLASFNLALFLASFSRLRDVENDVCQWSEHFLDISVHSLASFSNRLKNWNLHIYNLSDLFDKYAVWKQIEVSREFAVAVGDAFRLEEIRPKRSLMKHVNKFFFLFSFCLLH